MHTSAFMVHVIIQATVGFSVRWFLHVTHVIVPTCAVRFLTTATWVLKRIELMCMFVGSRVPHIFWTNQMHSKIHPHMSLMQLDYKNWSGDWRCQLWLCVHGLRATQQHHSRLRSNTTEQNCWTMASFETTFSWLWVCETIVQWVQSNIYAKLTVKLKHSTSLIVVCAQWILASVLPNRLKSHFSLCDCPHYN